MAMIPKECLLIYHRYYTPPNAVLIDVRSAYCRRLGKRKLFPPRVLRSCGGWRCVWRFSLLISAVEGGLVSFTLWLLSPEKEIPSTHLVEYLSGYQGRSGHCRRTFP
jgi:hypothetical protein